MSDVVIRTEGLTRDFKTVRAVDNLSIEVRQYRPWKLGDVLQSYLNNPNG